MSRAIRYVCMISIGLVSQMHSSQKLLQKSSSQQKAKRESEKFDEDLDRVGIRHRERLAQKNAVYALVQACSRSINLHNSEAVIRYIISKRPTVVKHLNDLNETPLATVVHGAFNASVENVKLLLNPNGPRAADAHALCIVLGTSKYRTTKEERVNGKKLVNLLQENGYRLCIHKPCKYSKRCVEGCEKKSSKK